MEYNIYTSNAGPMTKEEMRKWLEGARQRKLNDLCLVAAGWNPLSPEVKDYDFDKGGLPERIRSHAFSAKRDPNGILWIEQPDTDGLNKTDKNVFIEWLEKHPTWHGEPSCSRLIEAWKYYRLVSPHPESKIRNQYQGALRAIEAVRSDHPEIMHDNEAAKRALEDPVYAQFIPWLVYSRKPKKGLPLPLTTIVSNASHGKNKKLEVKTKSKH